MTYFDGFIVPVPEGNRDAYRKSAAAMAPIAIECGVARHVEAWDSDVPEGKLTDFRKAVDAKPDEKVVFSWFEYPSRAERMAANDKFMNDPRMKDMGPSLPFDGKRMIFGGFEVIVDLGSPGGDYADGWIVPVAEDKRDSYRQHAEAFAPLFLEHGASRVVEAWGDDLKHGEVTDFYRAVNAEPDETVVFATVEWPDKATRDSGWERMMKDERMTPQTEAPFDGKRMFWGGFEKLLDSAQPQSAGQQQQPAPVTA